MQSTAPARPRGHTEEKAGQVTRATKDKACEAKDRAADAAGQGATEGPTQKAGEAGNKTSEMAQAAKEKASQTAEASKQKASEATSDAVQYTKDSAVADKDNTGSVLGQVGEEVKNVVAGAKDAVANTLAGGWGGDNTTTKDTNST